MRSTTALIIAAAATALASPLHAQVRSISRIAEGGTIVVIGGEECTLSTFNAPFTNMSGQVGFTGVMISETAATVQFVWYDTGVVWTGSLATSPYTVSGAEGSMGIGDSGRFLYSPSIAISPSTSPGDGLWSDAGFVLAEPQPAPGISGRFITFASRPTMFGASDGAFVAGLATGAGGSSSARALYRVSLAGTPVFTPVFQSGDVIFAAPDNFPIAGVPNGNGINFAYDFSDNGQHLIQSLQLVTGSANNDTYLSFDGAPLAREGSPIPSSPLLDNWQNFTGMGVNNSGEHIVWGDSDTGTASDNFLAVNGVIVFREGNDFVAGEPLLPQANVMGASVNNLGVVVHAWTSGPTATANRFLAAGHVSDLAGTSVLLLKKGDQVDWDGDTIADGLVTDITNQSATTLGLDLADDGFVFIGVTLADLAGLNPRQAIIRLSVPVFGCSVTCDFNQDGGGDTSDVIDLADAIAAGTDPYPASCKDFNQDGGADTSDVIDMADAVASGTCP